MESMPQKPTDNNEQSSPDEQVPATDEFVFAPDGSRYSAEQAAAGYGMTPDSYKQATTATEFVYAPDGTPHPVDQAAAGYGMAADAYVAASANAYGNTPSAEAYRSPGQSSKNKKSGKNEKGGVPQFLGAIGGAAFIAYRAYEPLRETVDETAEVALDVSQQAFEFTADRPLLFAGVTALGIGAAAVKVWRDVRKHKHTANQEPQPYGNSYQAPNGS